MSADASHKRRLDDMERQISQLRERLDAAVGRQVAAPVPRERWIGRTCTISAEEYPGPGSDTFGVKLLSPRFSPEAPGNSTITAVERGTVVVARTLPARYVPEDTEVFVEHMRAVGTGGTWWIDGGIPQASSTFYTFLTGGAYSVPSSSSWSYELTNNGLTLAGLPIADGTIIGNAGEALGTRTIITTPGTYEVHGQATLVADVLSSSGGGFTPTDWQLALRLFNSATPATIVSGHANGRSSGITARTTVHAHGYLTFRDVPSPLAAWVDGQHYLAPLGMTLESWAVTLLKVAD